MKYMEVRKAERSDWTRAGQNRGTSKDLKAVSEALSYLQRKGLSTVEDLENFIETSGKSAADYRKQMKPKETRSNVIDAILAARTDCKECKPVYEKYQKIFFKKTKEKFKLEHPEVARFEKASAYLAKHPDDKDSTKRSFAGTGEACGRNRRLESTVDRGAGRFEEAAGHPLLGTESHTRHRGKQRAAQEAAPQRSLAG